MKRRPWSLSYLCCVLLLLIIPACSSDDGSPTDPGGGGGGGVVDTGDPATDAAIDQGLEVTNDLLVMMPEWASGNLTGPPTKEAEYSEACMCWTWQATLGDPYANPYEYTSWFFRAQFFDGETVIQGPQGADRAMVSVDYIWNKGFYPDEESKLDDESTSFTASLNISLSSLGSDPVIISGGGSAEFLSTGSRNGQFFELYGQFGMDLNFEQSLAGGCPNGMVVISQDLKLFSMSFDGTSTAWWTYTEGEQGSSIRGSETVLCGAD